MTEYLYTNIKADKHYFTALTLIENNSNSPAFEDF